jgi:2,3-bisphosphoglycerate-independent phosphoglycerate mutase
MEAASGLAAAVPQSESASMQNDPSLRRPVALIILDGWGIGRDEPGNAVLAAHTPVMDRLWSEYPHTTILTSGLAVGLPEGQMGNSEVGHMNLGAGFIVYQSISRIDKAIADGELAANPHLLAAIEECIDRGSTLHLVGLVSDGGVHSHTRHLVALVKIAAERGLDRILIHAFTDGRDTGPTTAREFVANLETQLLHIGAGRIASVSGRYYAMDRDHRWERTQAAFDAVVHGSAPAASSATIAIENAYESGVTDEFIAPVVVPGPDGSVSRISNDDVVISFNFRSDRMRQLIGALARPEFDAFDRGTYPTDVRVLTLTRYEEDLPVEVVFPPHDVLNPLARLISDAGLTQLHAAETEKYPHVTFFLNGGREEGFPGEARILIPSPKVATYDLQPAMSAPELTNAVVGAVRENRFDFIVVNFANGDMVGHTGVFKAAVSAIEVVDTCLGTLIDEVLNAGGRAIVTADHGNAEEMIDIVSGGPMTAHTTNPVPLVLVSGDTDPLRHAPLRDGAVLSAVAPTVLNLLGVPVPETMDQLSLVRLS